MPTYVYECDNCDHREERILSLAEHERDEQTCTECGDHEYFMHTVPQSVMTVGPMPSKTYYQVNGTQFEDSGHLRAHERENPNEVMVSQNDSWLRRHRDNARENAERLVKKMGYTDVNHKRSMDQSAKKAGFKSDVHRRNATTPKETS